MAAGWHYHDGCLHFVIQRLKQLISKKNNNILMRLSKKIRNIKIITTFAPK
jgi:hypothetical protein